MSGSYEPLLEEYEELTKEMVRLKLKRGTQLSEGDFAVASKTKGEIIKLSERLDELHRKLMDYVRLF